MMTVNTWMEKDITLARIVLAVGLAVIMGGL
jgi:hypothetical protein